MISRKEIITRQLQLITILVSGIAGTLLLFNLNYLTASHLRSVEGELIQQRSNILGALEDSMMRGKENDPTLNIAKDPDVRMALQNAINRLGVLKYVVVLDEMNTPITAVNLGRSDQIASSEQDLHKLLESNTASQIASLVWGQANYQLSFPVIVGRRTNGNTFTVMIRFGMSAASLRTALADSFIINLVIFFVGVTLSIIAARQSANLLVKPLEELMGQLEKMEKGEVTVQEEGQKSFLAGSSIALRLQLLGKRLAGERTELEATRGRLTQIIGNIEERLLMLNPDRRVMLMSPKADHLLGVPGIDLSGAKLEDKLGPNHPLLELINRVQQSRASVENIMFIDQHGQGPRQVLTSVQYIEDKNEPVGMLVSLRDFDSFRLFQSQLDYSDKLAALGRITSGVAHEVKNPLNAMVIHLEIMRAKLFQAGADITPQLDILSSEIKRLDRVVQTFLNFTRPVQVNLVPIDLNDLVHQVTRLAAAEAGTHKVELREELSPDFLRVNGDADLLKQTLLNIIINGCQAMPKGGPLEIRTKRSGTYVLITIVDRGLGIPEDVRDKIFKLYYTTKENGNGIGLAQAFRIIQLHNGRIEFESMVDIGTTFRIFLPEV